MCVFVPVFSPAPERALCAEDGDPEAWFADPVADPLAIAHAVAVCGSCSLRTECQSLAPDHDYGVWGGILARKTATAELDGRRAKIIDLSHSGYSEIEIAQTLGVRRDLVRSSLRRAA